MSRAVSRAFRQAALAVALCVPAAVPAQVTYFQQPPTPEQLRAALMAVPAAPRAVPGAVGSAAGTRPPGVRTRGIVWNAPADAPGGAPATAAASAAAPLPPSAAAAEPVATAHPVSLGNVRPAAALPISFDSGSRRVDTTSLPYLESIAAMMKSDPSLQLVIEGHTDGRGSFNRNMLLSWDRALGVLRTLVEVHGIDPVRLQPVGRGPLDPIPGMSPSDSANRRVQFRIGS
ncbi:MAG: OmpA family protein [Lautropia sp.]